MSRLNGRISRLEAEEQGDVALALGLPPDFIDREFERWDVLLDDALSGVEDEAAELLAVKYAQQKLANLYGTVNYEGDNLGWAQRQVMPLRRFPKALAVFLDRLPREMRGSALKAGLTQAIDTYTASTWLEQWLRELCNLDNRIPPDIDCEAFGSVVDVLVNQRDEIDAFYGTCPATGLRLPRVKSPPLNKWWPLLPG